MIPRKKNKLVMIALLVSCCATAQQFQYTAMLDTVGKDGFYSIPVSPELSSYIKTDLSDIRIADEKNQWIPHIINWSLKNIDVDNVYYELPVIKKKNTKNSTIIIVNNPGKNNVSNLFLELKNTAASRMAVISGGDDQKSWFTITDSILLSAPEIIAGNKPAFKISFPFVNYNYFKIIIFNGKNDPFNIQEVMNDGPGVMEKKERFITNPQPIFTQKDTTGFSLIRIENPKPFHFNKLKISVSSPKFFDRRAKLYAGSSAENINSLMRLRPVKEYILTSGNTEDYATSWMKDSLFYLLIENKDNPPLQIKDITTEQISKELIAYLEKGKQYRLLFNNPGAIAPDYDLLKFSDRIPDSMSLLKTGSIVPVNPVSSVDRTEGKNNSKQWIWPAIIGVIALLSYLAWALTKDIRKS